MFILGPDRYGFLDFDTNVMPIVPADNRYKDQYLYLYYFPSQKKNFKLEESGQRGL